MKTIIWLAAALAVSLGAAFAADAVHQASGTVTRIDQGKARVTVKHGPVPSLKWPSMTMGFGVKDKALLQKVKPGDKIEFSFVQSGRDYTITEIK
jgi:Cu(I)/Ag(I) efflux system protein CusF